MNNNVELLAPAGNYEAFLGAVNAGADAVYLGGEKFGARAYADNFTTEEICSAIHTAHFMGRKIYLTVNTLVKQTELDELYNWLLPFYESGLDGVIVQDIGVLRFIRDHFKDLKLHASTQMTLTGAYGASFMKSQGVERIVPARELSLAEVREIKERTGLEIECFIHGAMCYCYSGLCLFSSILGGRSGNRGRCAQPCRLPYQIYEGKKNAGHVEYPLSLKDMCTVSYIPQLIEAGIDSFKIEGRMKKPEYAAGVTSLYRKYIDLYYQKGSADYHVSEEDLEILRSLYIRSEVQTGYYERHNGHEMITLHKPGYVGSDQNLLNRIRKLYIRNVDRLPVKMNAVFKTGELSCLAITDSREVSVTVYGSTVETAQKMPLKEEDIRRQLTKTGNSLVQVSECAITMDGDIFMPVSALNDLRRKGVEEFERKYIEARGMVSCRNQKSTVDKCADNRLTESVDGFENVSDAHNTLSDRENSNTAIDILISTYEQLIVAMKYPCRRIYIDSDLYVAQHEQITLLMKEHTLAEYYLVLPYVIRLRDKHYLHRLTELIAPMINGFLIRNLEEATFVKNFDNTYKIVLDAGLYVFNTETVDFWSHYCTEYTLPYELNAKEAAKLSDYARSIGMQTTMIVYGRIPMMITANCIRKTAGNCTVTDHNVSESIMVNQGTVRKSTEDGLRIRDRYGTDFPVETNCTHCYNIIYNSMPYSLHLQSKELSRIAADALRYDFSLESARDCRRILEGDSFPYEQYTTGHLKRGVE